MPLATETLLDATDAAPVPAPVVPDAAAQTAASEGGPGPAAVEGGPASAAAIPDLSPAACAARLAELFPALFTPGAAKPLKLRIQADIQQRAPGVFTKKTLSVFLHRHTTSTAYLRAMTTATERVGLDGEPAGPIADEHRAAAVAEVQRRRGLQDERRAAEREAARAKARAADHKARQEARQARDAQRQAEEAARQQNEVDGKGRADRAALLRAYEASTLTRSNFCALKRMTEAELDAALAVARAERESRGLPPKPRL